MAHRDARGSYWSLPVVAETYDGGLNDINGMHVTAAHVHEALAGANDGAVAEGNVGGGTGMVCHEFKGGTGTASRVVNGWHVGAIVQANYGDRERLTIDGVPVGLELSRAVIPSAWDDEEAIARRGAGSIIVVLATDAPLLPHQLQRLAQRAGLGIARMGGSGAHSSGDIFIDRGSDLQRTSCRRDADRTRRCDRPRTPARRAGGRDDQVRPGAFVTDVGGMPPAAVGM
jgi:D-aminopeptidase